MILISPLERVKFQQYPEEPVRLFVFLIPAKIFFGSILAVLLNPAQLLLGCREEVWREVAWH